MVGSERGNIVARAIKTCSLMAATLLLAYTITAFGQGKQSAEASWVVGYWEGKLSDPSKDKGAIFEIRVKSVGDDGNFAGEWDVYAGGHDVGQGKVQGDVVTLKFRNGNLTTLRRQGADNLVGSTALAKGGQTNEFIFVKRSSDANAPTSSGRGCTFNAVEGRNGNPAPTQWHLNEGAKTKYFDKLWQNGTLIGDGSFLCQNGHLVKAE
jgi:hypothetical protein